LNNNYVKAISVILLVLTAFGCNNVGGSTNNYNKSTDLQAALNTSVNSINAKINLITGIPLTFQCNGFNNNLALSISSGKLSIKNNALNMPNNAIYQIGSSTKSFTAVVALQLADEINPDNNEKYFGDKGLDSTIGEVLGNLPGSHTWNAAWNEISIRELLNMTSGIPDYVNKAFLVYANDPDHYFSSDELIQYAVNEKPVFEHGHGWQYSNTNYVIMNKIITYLTHSSMNEQITKRIINKLDMNHTYYVDHLPMDAITRPEQKQLLVSGYFGGQKFGKLDYYTDLSLNSLSITNAAGSIISNVIDMNKYIHALFDDKNGLLNPSQYAQLTRMVATEDTDGIKAGQYLHIVDKPSKNKNYGLGYGLGIMESFIKLPNGNSITMYEHGGDTLSFDSNWLYSPQKQVYAMYSFNSQAPYSKIRSFLESKIYEKIDMDCTSN
jgi:D-alanyl-D-alanine carboxypeptidase